MDKTVKIQFTPKLDFDSGCETVEVEMLNPVYAVDDRLDEIECQINELDTSIDKLTNHADKADYAVAVVSGILTGFLDAMFVKKLELQSIDDIIKSFAKYKGWGEDSNSSYQTFLENKYHTPNDAAYQKGKDIFGKKLNVGGKTHRFDEIAHHPTIEGLFASIIIRFFKVTVYDKNGKKHITTVNTSAKDIATTVIPILITGAVVWLAEMAEKYSNADIDTKLPKILIDIIKMLSTVPMIIEVLKTADNWLGHIMSDVATPSGIPGVFLSFLKHISSSRLSEQIKIHSSDIEDIRRIDENQDETDKRHDSLIAENASKNIEQDNEIARQQKVDAKHDRQLKSIKILAWISTAIAILALGIAIIGLIL